ncbi:MAG: glycosyltransferase [Prochlorotrichaceae cyanobacterium]|jgi:glycosyltransferase involved in cell wall biosynthesis
MSSQPDITILMRWLRGGGAERICATLANQLAECGYQVDLILFKAEGEYLETLHEKINVIDLALTSVTARKGWKPPSSLQSLRAIFRLIDYIRTHNPKVILASTHYVNEVAILSKFFVRNPPQVIIAEHTHVSTESKYSEPISARLIPFSIKLLYPFANKIVAVSQGVADDLNHHLMFKRNISVIYNPVINSQLYEQSEQGIEHPWFQQKDRPVLVASGRFVCQKDFLTLIKAFAKVLERQKAYLILLGDGVEKKKIIALIQSLNLEEYVFLTGFISNPYAYLKQADLFVSSSRWEGLPTTIIEALALQIPVVATDCPSGPAEILKNGEYGYLIPVGDEVALAAAIVLALRSEPKCVPQSWINEFTCDVAIQKYINILGCQKI